MAKGAALRLAKCTAPAECPASAEDSRPGLPQPRAGLGGGPSPSKHTAARCPTRCPEHTATRRSWWGTKHTSAPSTTPKHTAAGLRRGWLPKGPAAT